MFRRLTSTFLSVGAAALLFWACRSVPARGTLEVRIKDHREAIGDFTKVEFTVHALRIKPGRRDARQPGWSELTPAMTRVDLTRFAGGQSALIFRGEMDSGSFEAVDLKVGEIVGVLKQTGGKTPVKNQLGPIRLPLSIHRDRVTLIVLDLTVIDNSDHPRRGYELHIKGYELYTDGRITDKIPPG